MRGGDSARGGEDMSAEMISMLIRVGIGCFALGFSVCAAIFAFMDVLDNRRRKRLYDDSDY